MRRILPGAQSARLLTLLNSPDTLNAALAGAGAGNVDNGTHVYGVSFVTAIGESEVSVLSAAVTVADKTTNGQVALTNIPKGPAGTTARKIYRSAAGLTALKLQSTIANNTATTATDNLADSGLGASPLTTDYSGLPMIRGYYAYLNLSVEGTGNSAIIYVDASDDSNVNATSGIPLAPATANIRNNIELFATDDGGMVRAGSIWVFTPSAGQILIISGQEV